ncbi:MAG: hypothetical protein BZ137_01245 [Methanosphaera sp. rholeuAM130]|nr:MAG: hypothetical protein BZ137_01245 [Methanosphaera sp. rholeuAM130]
MLIIKVNDKLQLTSINYNDIHLKQQVKNELFDKLSEIVYQSHKIIIRITKKIKFKIKKKWKVNFQNTAIP